MPRSIATANGKTSKMSARIEHLGRDGAGRKETQLGVEVTNRFTVAGLICVAVSMVGALLLVTDLLLDDPAAIAGTTGLAALGCLVFWCLAPLRRRPRIRPQAGGASLHTLSGGTPEPKAAAATARQ